MKNTQKKAFTLIELLVVIAIIAILAAILFPVFGRARENARRSSCQSNMKQIGLGIMQYTQDYDEKYPKAQQYDLGGLNRGPDWRQMVQPYLKSTQVFQCPSNPDKDRVSAVAKGGFPAINVSYAAPQGRWWWDYAGAMQLPWGQPTSLASITIPDNMISVMETTYVGIEGASEGQFMVDRDGGEFDNAMFAGHLGRFNALFADGHVKATLPLQTIPPTMGGSGASNMYAWDGASWNYEPAVTTAARNATARYK